MQDFIYVKGARENNLKNIDIRLPRDKFIVLTGLSGSGKSSLAFDTIYAEGQRRYVESLSAYARQFLGQMEKPLVESIDGLSPAISIDQKTTSKNPRSTVGTITEIYDYFRLLFARVGTPHCPECNRVIEPTTVDEIVDKIMNYPVGEKLYIMAPVIRGQKGTHVKVLEALKKDGFVRVRIDGEIYDLSSDGIHLEKNKTHTIDVIVDRLVIKEGLERRLSDSVETALKLEESQLKVQFLGQDEHIFNMSYSCPIHGKGIEEMEPRMFSFNSPFGACEKCKGLGFLQEIDPELVIPDKSLSINEGGILPFKNVQDSSYTAGMIKALLKGSKMTMNTPLEDFPEKDFNRLLYGDTGKEIEIEYESTKYGKKVIKSTYEGVINNLKRRYFETTSSYIKDWIDGFMAEVPCPHCQGKRLKDEVLSVTIGDRSIIELTEMSVLKIHDFFQELTLSKQKANIAELVVKEIKARIQFLVDVGLGYLTLARQSATLSGGEAQRIRLATQIGSGLMGVLYILDEPSIGLHQKDNDKLLKTLRELTDLGNTLLVVEHDEDTMLRADHIVDIGPGAGENGGYIVAQGTADEIMKVSDSITGQYLSGVKRIEIPKTRRKQKGEIQIKGAKENNLKDIDVSIPLGVFTCVTGVSGSGKSTLINDIFYQQMYKNIYKNHSIKPGKHTKIVGWEHINKVINIDQSPIGRTPRSNPATYTKLFDHIRDLFAALPESNMRGFNKGRFSFNVKGGRCEACSGDGILRIEMNFLPDVYVKCETCKGKRYNRETLEVKYKGKNIYDVLEMTVNEAVEFFSVHTSLVRKLKTLQDVGLGYIKLGQPSTQLSGGEAQRVKLATELSKVQTGDTLYILDEPTTGLHMADVHMLIGVLNRLVDAGNTLVVIEHNLDVIKSADHIIDLGPEGGDGGGEVIAIGTPEQVAKNKKSYTGHYLKQMLRGARQ